MQSMSTGLPYASDANLRAIRETVQEVGKLAVASQGLFGAMRAGIAAVQGQVASFVALANPAAFQKFKLAVDDLHGVIGRALLPVLNNFTTVIQKIADYFHALSPAAKSMIAGLTAAAVGFTVVTVAVWAMNAALSTMTGGLTAVIGAIASLVVGILFATSGTDKLKNGFDAMMGPLSKVLDAFGEIAGLLAEAIAPIMETVFALLAATLQEVAKALQSVMPELRTFAAFIRAVAEFVADIVGLDIQADGAPNRAPPAVRQSQIGDMSSFISRQYVNSFNGGSPEQKKINMMEGLKAEVQGIKNELVKIFGEAKDIHKDLMQLIGRGRRFVNDNEQEVKWAVAPGAMALRWLHKQVAD